MVNMITEQEAEKIELEFMDAMPEWRNYSKEKAEGLYKAWNHLWALMERENNFSDKLGSSILDWQIGNWAGDLTMVLHNAGLYNEVIKINEQILQIKWSSNRDDFYENAKRDIADAYADLGDIDKCYQLYEKYLVSSLLLISLHHQAVHRVVVLPMEVARSMVVVRPQLHRSRIPQHRRLKMLVTR